MIEERLTECVVTLESDRPGLMNVDVVGYGQGTLFLYDSVAAKVMKQFRVT